MSNINNISKEDLGEVIATADVETMLFERPSAQTSERMLKYLKCFRDTYFKEEVVMKTFKDLEFKVHPNACCGYDTEAVLMFANGLGISVITGERAYSGENAPYEIAIIGEEYNALCNAMLMENGDGYCIGWLTEEGVTSYMIKIQEFSANDN